MTTAPLSGRTLIFVVACRQLRRALRNRFRHLREMFDVHIFYRVTHQHTQEQILGLLEQKYRAGISPNQIHLFLITGWHPHHENHQQKFLAGDLPCLIYERTNKLVPPTAEIDIAPVPRGQSDEQMRYIGDRVERFLWQEYFPFFRNGIT